MPLSEIKENGENIDVLGVIGAPSSKKNCWMFRSETGY